MKNHNIKNALSIIIAMIMIIGVFSISAFAATAPTPSTGDVSINGATPEDIFSAYKIIDITYNSESNTLKYAWSSDVQTLLNNKGDTTTVETFANYEKDDRQEFLAVITKDLTENATAVKTNVKVDESGNAIFQDLGWGQYLLVPTLTTSVYEIMIGGVQPKVSGSSWDVTQGEALTVKKSDGPKITKKANNTNVGSWSKITYTLEFDVPKYDGTVVDSTFTILDKADNFLKYKGNLKIYGVVGNEETELSLANVTKNDSSVIPDVNASGYTITLDYNYESIKSYNKIKVTYDAGITDDAPLNSNIANTATLTYSNYPYVEGSHKTVTDNEQVKTYGLKLFKYDGATSTKSIFSDVTNDTQVKALSDAVFDVYRPIEGNETGESVKGINENVVKITTITSDDTGYAILNYIKSGKYYLVETSAPTGYNLLTSPIEINFTEDNLDTDGYFDQLVANSNGFILPQTGGIGTTIFTITGIILMVGAVVLLLVVKKRKKSENK